MTYFNAEQKRVLELLEAEPLSLKQLIVSGCDRSVVTELLRLDHIHNISVGDKGLLAPGPQPTHSAKGGPSRKRL